MPRIVYGITLGVNTAQLLTKPLLDSILPPAGFREKRQSTLWIGFSAKGARSENTTTAYILLLNRVPYTSMILNSARIHAMTHTPSMYGFRVSPLPVCIVMHQGCNTPGHRRSATMGHITTRDNTRQPPRRRSVSV